jgi:hypothetical protein
MQGPSREGRPFAYRAPVGRWLLLNCNLLPDTLIKPAVVPPTGTFYQTGAPPQGAPVCRWGHPTVTRGVANSDTLPNPSIPNGTNLYPIMDWLQPMVTAARAERGAGGTERRIRTETRAAVYGREPIRLVLNLQYPQNWGQGWG